jgi:hypothetical protein
MRRGTATRERQSAPAEAPEKPQIIGGDPNCVHHWVIDSPAGSVSAGFCKLCGAHRMFANYVSDFIYEGDSPETLPQAGWKRPVTELVRPGVGESEESSSGSEGDY